MLVLNILRRKNRFMNIQIFGTKKCNDTKKAQSYYKERGIKFQFIDMSEKEISKVEFPEAAGRTVMIRTMQFM